MIIKKKYYFKNFIKNDVSALVADSPFSNLSKLSLENVKNRYHIPEFLTSTVLHFLKKSISEAAGFNIEDLDIIKFLKSKN